MSPSQEAGPTTTEVIQSLHRYLLTVQAKTENEGSRIVDVANDNHLPSHLKDYQSDPKHEMELEKLELEMLRRAIAEILAAPLMTRLHSR